jgi:hypothetical protein
MDVFERIAELELALDLLANDAIYKYLNQDWQEELMDYVTEVYEDEEDEEDEDEECVGYLIVRIPYGPK